VDFDYSEWESDLRAIVQKKGILASVLSIEYYIFPRMMLYKKLPPFLVGRPEWDNWLIWKVRSQHIPVLDATDTILSIHQKHDRKWHKEGTREFNEGIYNSKLTGGGLHIYTISNASHFLKRESIITRKGHRFDFARNGLNRVWRKVKKHLFHKDV
jgi:hypothetical protein